MKQSKAGRRENAQRRIAEFHEYFSDALLLNCEHNGEDHEAIVSRVQKVHDTLGIDSANSSKICAAMRLPRELEAEPVDGTVPVEPEHQPTGGTMLQPEPKGTMLQLETEAEAAAAAEAEAEPEPEAEAEAEPEPVIWL